MGPANDAQRRAWVEQAETGRVFVADRFVLLALIAEDIADISAFDTTYDAADVWPAESLARLKAAM